MIVTKAMPSTMICLGRSGENNARQVEFDITRWRGLYGDDGQVQLIAQRTADEEPYPCAIEVDGPRVLWTVSAADTAKPGNYGRCELSYHVNGTLAKSETWQTFVLASMGAATGDPPEAYQAWIDQVVAVGAAAEESARKAEEALLYGPVIGENGNWYLWNAVVGEYEDTGRFSGGAAPYIGANGNWYVGPEDTGVKAQGPQGDPGAAGPKGDTGAPGPQGPAGANGYTPVRGVDYWTEEDKQEILDEVGSEQAETEKRLEKLEEQMGDLLYKAISITSFSHNAGTKEMGDTVTGVTLNWATNKKPTTLTLDGEPLDVTLKSKALSGLNITLANNKSWTLKATDERGAMATATVGVSFQNGIYYGAAAVPATIDSAFIMSLANKQLRSTKNQTVTIAGGDGLYAWYAYPARLGTSLFNIGGFDYEYEVKTVPFTNIFGFHENYYVYRSGQYAPASLSVTVKNGG